MLKPARCLSIPSMDVPTFRSILRTLVERYKPKNWAAGLDPFEAAYAGAWIHAEAGRLGAMTAPQGILAGDLLSLLPAVAADRVYERGPSWRK